MSTFPRAFARDILGSYVETEGELGSRVPTEGDIEGMVRRYEASEFVVTTTLANN